MLLSNVIRTSEEQVLEEVRNVVLFSLLFIKSWKGTLLARLTSMAFNAFDKGWDRDR